MRMAVEKIVSQFQKGLFFCLRMRLTLFNLLLLLLLLFVVKHETRDDENTFVGVVVDTKDQSTTSQRSLLWEAKPGADIVGDAADESPTGHASPPARRRRRASSTPGDPPQEFVGKRCTFCDCKCSVQLISLPMPFKLDRRPSRLPSRTLSG